MQILPLVHRTRIAPSFTHITNTARALRTTEAQFIAVRDKEITNLRTITTVTSRLTVCISIPDFLFKHVFWQGRDATLVRLFYFPVSYISLYFTKKKLGNR